MANTGMNPRNVISPQANWHLLEVLVEEEHWSMALGRWKSHDGTWRPVLAQRWNGEQGGKGNPVSRGFPTWFILPDDTYGLYIDDTDGIASEIIPAEKKARVRASLGFSDTKDPA